MHPNLLYLFNSIHPLTEAAKSFLDAKIRVYEFSKKAYLLKEGQVCNDIYFIESGLIKSFYKKEDKEVTSWFMKENDIVISVKSFLKREKSYEYIQAIENSVVHAISHDDLDELYKVSLEFNIIGRIVTETYYVLSEERLFSMRKQKAEERFAFLLKEHPEIIQRAPVKDIASYLGISQETLSRIRSKMI
jgi:CRP/FNR family transcriptional regulator, anaerobic regulatory protein